MRVLYLHREVEGSKDRLIKFIKSLNMQLLKDPISFSLCILIKGPLKSNLDDITSRLKDSQVKLETILELPDDGFDLGAYYRACKIISDQPTLFLNSYSRFRTLHSLQILKETWSDLPDDSILGCTSSFGSHSRRSLFYNRRSLMFLPFTIFWNRSFDNNFPKMPNPHVRTSGFICNSLKLKKYFDIVGMPRTKKDCYAVEFGYHNLTNFFSTKYILSTKKLFKVNEVVDGGFRNKHQENLLISDNNTDFYDQASIVRKKILTYKSYL
jgi:hypothetical protein